VRTFLLALATLCAASSLWAMGPQSESVLREADRAYRAAQYQAAEDGYQRLLADRRASGHLLYNLGTLAFRLNQTGRAILYYERAGAAAPRPRPCLQPRPRARTGARHHAGIGESRQHAFFWLGSLTLAEVFWGFAAANLLFWSVMAVRLFSRSEWTYYLLFLFLAAWLLSGASFWMKWHQAGSDDRRSSSAPR